MLSIAPGALRAPRLQERLAVAAEQSVCVVKARVGSQAQGSVGPPTGGMGSMQDTSEGTAGLSLGKGRRRKQSQAILDQSVKGLEA